MEKIILPEYLIFDGEEAKLTKFYGYYATRSGKIISIKVKGGQGSVNINKPRLHVNKIDKDGYCEVCLSIIDNDGVHKRIYRRVHRLIWETFNGEIPDNLTVDHIDENKCNNDISNLRLLTRENNTSYRQKGLVSPKRSKFNLYFKESFIGEYDAFQLAEFFKIKKTDFKKFDTSMRIKILYKFGYRIEKIN